ncbi:hypothetical protein DFH05DRAFT_1534117 [Lentinula detonsa]|uniref:Uncharacterized protein n=1 Tax=Lentinula detonsa TaxID=2804962 RepID=A0A9W8P380_9AGAR|nr:hypothetical protein DFH05DRAFT_1534117 [Lentinula detonsa]
MVLELGTLAFLRIAGFANSLFMAYAFRTYQYSLCNLDRICSWNPLPTRVFRKTAWAACSINFGPRTATYPHIDHANLCFGWCAITALGSFNPDLGGHLVLWDLGLAIRFPPGATILIPSALLTHSNVPVCQGEERYSFVQYSSAGLFQWVENSSMSDLDFGSQASVAEKKQCEYECKQRWETGLEMFTRWPEVQEEAKRVAEA